MEFWLNISFIPTLLDKISIQLSSLFEQNPVTTYKNEHAQSTLRFFKPGSPLLQPWVRYYFLVLGNFDLEEKKTTTKNSIPYLLSMKTYSRFAILIKKGIRRIWFAGSQKHHILRWVLFILPVFQVFSPFIAVYRRLLFCFNLQMDYSRDLQSILVKYFLSFMFFKRIGGLADASWNYVWCIWSLRTEFWNLGGTKWNVFCGIYWNGKDAFISNTDCTLCFCFQFFSCCFLNMKIKRTSCRWHGKLFNLSKKMDSHTF